MEQAGKSSGGKLAIIITGIVVLALAVVFVAYSYLTKSFIFAEKPRPEKTTYTYRLEEIVVNLKDQGRYLKTTIALGYGLEEDIDTILGSEVQLRDAFVSILRGKAVADIMPVENTAGLKKEMLEKANECFDEELITDVFISDFLIQ